MSQTPKIQVEVSLWKKIPSWGSARKYPNHTFYTVDVISPPEASAEEITEAIRRQIKRYEESLP